MFLRDMVHSMTWTQPHARVTCCALIVARRGLLSVLHLHIKAFGNMLRWTTEMLDVSLRVKYLVLYCFTMLDRSAFLVSIVYYPFLLSHVFLQVQDSVSISLCHGGVWRNLCFCVKLSAGTAGHSGAVGMFFSDLLWPEKFENAMITCL